MTDSVTRFKRIKNGDRWQRKNGHVLEVGPMTREEKRRQHVEDVLWRTYGNLRAK